ncbi:MAG: sigma-70 family RNA polymerase sigma factor [Candidatus Dojkabacteria bacterium]|nr:sigma-70 family RNA polymerase sigma factor [Candidatus Dojkabacteria bacterium]
MEKIPPVRYYSSMSASMSEDRSSVRKAQSDPGAFSALYVKYYPRIWAFIRKLVNNETIADDLCASTFEKALSKIPSFQWKGVGVSSWLYRIARNTVYDYFRSSRTKRSTALSDTEEETPEKEAGPEEKTPRHERELNLYEGIASLEKQDQYLLYYRYFEGMSVKDIAVKFGMSRTNAATRLHRIRNQMKRLLEPL